MFSMTATIIIFAYFAAFAVVQTLSSISNSTSIQTKSYIADHRFLFISGWPQSGTSLMQQIFTVSPYTSTMVEKCTRIIPGSKCLDWNYEGQWALKFAAGARGASNATSLLNPGSMCEGKFRRDEMQNSPSVSYSDKKKILQKEFDEGMDLTHNQYWAPHWDAIFNITSTWQQFWNLKKPLLVEKSPHSMLKSHLLREIFSSAQSVKFIVVLKHPVTLNVALPRDCSWTTRKIKKYNETSKTFYIIPDAPLSLAEIEANARFFIRFMKHEMMGKGSTCTLGWLAAMDELYSDLQWGTDSAKFRDTKIVRFEDFSSPLLLCKSIFRFVHEKDENKIQESVRKVCIKYFSPKEKRRTRPLSRDESLLMERSRSSRYEQKRAIQAGKEREKKSREERMSLVEGVDSVRPEIGVETSESLVLSVSNIASALGASDITMTNTSTNNTIKNKLWPENVDENRRKLRLKWSRSISETTLTQAHSLEFIPHLYSVSTDARFGDYQRAYQLLPKILQLELDVINERLKTFGYSLEKGQEKWFQKNKSAFDPWTKYV